MICIPQEVYAGEDFYLPLVYQQDYCGQSYPIDITGYAFEFQVGNGIFIAGNTPLLDSSTANGLIIMDSPSGQINIWIPNRLITTTLIGCYDCGLKAVNAIGLVERLFGGPFQIKGW